MIGETLGCLPEMNVSEWDSYKVERLTAAQCHQICRETASNYFAVSENRFDHI